MGVALSAIFIVICITGILLNHSDDLDFQSRTIKANWIYDWYDREPSSEILHFELSDGSISAIDSQIFFKDNSIGNFSKPVGVAELESIIAIAFRDSLVLTTKEGEVIETIPSVALPGTPIALIASKENRILIIDTNKEAFESDEDILNWQTSKWDASLAPLNPSKIPQELETKLLQAYRGEGITWGRVLLDIHTGRFFGSAGKWIADLSALALILLTVTGVFYTTRYLKKARERVTGRKS
ncbi:PepSY-associated TM helix family [Verrucomicrobiia bacterium DG1235]|nr:PepSY-associated TM helix family [Verrucomicrobiae bacterium DG1235]